MSSIKGHVQDRSEGTCEERQKQIEEFIDVIVDSIIDMILEENQQKGGIEK